MRTNYLEQPEVRKGMKFSSSSDSHLFDMLSSLEKAGLVYYCSKIIFFVYYVYYPKFIGRLQPAPNRSSIWPQRHFPRQNGEPQNSPRIRDRSREILQLSQYARQTSNLQRLGLKKFWQKIRKDFQTWILSLKANFYMIPSNLLKYKNCTR